MRIILFTLTTLLLLSAGCGSSLTPQAQKQQKFEDLLGLSTCQVDEDCELILARQDGCCSTCDTVAASRDIKSQLVDWDKQNCQGGDYTGCPYQDCAVAPNPERAVCQYNTCQKATGL